MGSSRDTILSRIWRLDPAQSVQQPILLVGHFCPYLFCQGDLGQTFCFCDVGAYKDPMDTIPIGTVKACLDCETVIPGSTTLYPNSRYSHECVCPAGLLILEHFGRLGKCRKLIDYVSQCKSSIGCDLHFQYPSFGAGIHSARVEATKSPWPLLLDNSINSSQQGIDMSLSWCMIIPCKPLMYWDSVNSPGHWLIVGFGRLFVFQYVLPSRIRYTLVCSWADSMALPACSFGICTQANVDSCESFHSVAA